MGVGYEWWPLDDNGQQLDTASELLPIRVGMSTNRGLKVTENVWFKNLPSGGDEMVLIDSNTGKLSKGTLNTGGNATTEYISINCVGYSRQVISWLVEEPFHYIPAAIATNRITEITASYGDGYANNNINFELIAEDGNNNVTQVATWTHTLSTRFHTVTSANGIINTATNWSDKTLRVRTVGAPQNYEGAAGYTVTIKLEV